jgi:hypothetical protein
MHRITPQHTPNKPLGIYAKVDISAEILKNSGMTAAQLNSYFNGLYLEMLQNTAVSGLAIQAHWDTLNPNPPGSAKPYDWTYLDDAFAQVWLWNWQNPNLPRKTIQLIITPGFQSPPWLLQLLPPCDALFSGGTPASNCGSANFAGFGPEEADGTVLPLPWNRVYKSAWRQFLIVLNERYGWDPALVSIAVAGPTAASAEMILPNDSNTPHQIYGTSPNTISVSANTMWLELLAFQYPEPPAYQNSDQAFIDEWDAAINLYGEIFHGLTLIATTGSGLPNLNATDFTIPPAFAADCPTQDMDCGAETSILSYFVNPFVGGFNAKATQTSGMEASRGDSLSNLGVAGVKLISQATQYFGWPSAQILGGAQFNTSVANNAVTEGGNAEFPDPTVEQGLFKVYAAR